MARYIFRRLLLMIPVLICVSFVVFFLMDLAPGDIVSQMAPSDATPEQIEMLREELGLNGTVLQRYGRYLWNLLHGDMGTSLSLKRPVIEVFAERLPATLKLAFASIVIALLISIPLGIAAATHHRSWLDGSSVVLSMLSVSMPAFWLGLLLIFAFWVCIPLLVIGLFAGCRYAFSGAELGRESVNSAMDKAAEVAEKVKEEVTGEH